MKEKKITILTVLVISFFAIGICLYHAYKPLPVIYSTSTYPDYNLAKLVEESENIVYGKFVEIGATQMREVFVSATLEPSKVEDVLYYPVTPVTISVENAVKGNASSNIVYYEESGVTDTYIQKPEGYQLVQGMDVILFLNESGYGWGGQSVYPVIEDQVILQEKVLKEIPSNKINSISFDTIKENYGISSSYKEEYVKTISLDEFLDVIISYK